MAEHSYLRVAHGGRWWKLLLELVLAPVWWVIGAGVVGIAVLSATGAKKLDDLDVVARLVVMHLSIAMMTPAALCAALVIGRRPGFLLSLAGRLRWRWLGRCVGFAFAIQLAFIGFGVLVELIGSGSIDSLSHGGPRLWQVVAVTLLLVPFQASGEEVFNRGTLQQIIGGWGAPAWVAIGVSTAAFVAMHGMPNVGTIAIAAMGISYAWLTLETGGLEAAIAGHTMNNIVAFILAAAAHGTKALDPQELNERVGWASVVIQVVMIALYTVLVIRAWRRSTQAG
ncbi:MAG TPA: CPBP family intramembrane glutamic endopeptidase [Kofleriaceae bacterium]|nr:CPBP family intramembrane glutamic endopeptidase [Kofleriaceae bacterium]